MMLPDKLPGPIAVRLRNGQPVQLFILGNYAIYTIVMGKKLTDDAVIESLERLEMDVIYDFDRSHEGQPDKYWAASKKDGLQFRFNEPDFECCFSSRHTRQWLYGFSRP